MRCNYLLGGLLASIATAGVAFGSSIPRASPHDAEIVLYNGKIVTEDPARPEASALAISGERIVAVGDDATVRRLAGASTRSIDLGGRTVVPGINDAHAHLGVEPANTVELELSGANPDWQTLKSVLAATVTQLPPGTPITATIGTTIFGDLKVYRDTLDEVAPKHPVMLSTFDGHAMILNSAALSNLGIGENVRDPLGGRYERSAKGRLTGVVREYAANNAMRQLAGQVPDADAAAILHRQLVKLAKYGVTTVQVLPFDMSPERMVRLLDQSPVPIRVRVTRMNSTGPTGRDLVEGHGVPEHPAQLVTVGGTKWMLDGVVFEGSLTTRDATTGNLATQSAHTLSGLPLLFDRRELVSMLQESIHDNSQLEVHVFGRPAAAAMLDAMEQAGGAKVWRSRRVRFEHGDGLTPDLLKRVAALGVVVSQQGTHLGAVEIDTSFGPAFAAQVRAKKQQLLRSLLEAGIPLALGSDGSFNPYLGILVASLHPDHPDEAISRAQALAAYTLGSAYAEFTESDKGSLEPGKLADLAVLSQDIFSVPSSELPKTSSVLTLVGGRTAYDAGVLK
jgi:predicted amidohydrolase YtcJ